MKRIWISAGHQENTGANGYIKEGEQAIYLRDKITAYLKDKAPNLEVANDSDKDTLQQTIQGMRTFNPDVSIDVHFNSFSKESATGSEIYVPCDATADVRELAGKIVASTAETLGINNRGVKIESNSQHDRLGMLHGVQGGKLMLLEICFVTNKNDSDRYMANRDILAEKIADVILARFMQ